MQTLAKCIRMRNFATKISKISRIIAPGLPFWGGAIAPLPDPTPLALQRFAPPTPRSGPSSPQSSVYVSEWRYQKLATLIRMRNFATEISKISWCIAPGRSTPLLHGVCIMSECTRSK